MSFVNIKPVRKEEEEKMAPGSLPPPPYVVPLPPYSKEEKSPSKKDFCSIDMSGSERFLGIRLKKKNTWRASLLNLFKIRKGIDWVELFALYCLLILSVLLFVLVHWLIKESFAAGTVQDDVNSTVNNSISSIPKSASPAANGDKKTLRNLLEESGFPFGEDDHAPHRQAAEDLEDSIWTITDVLDYAKGHDVKIRPENQIILPNGDHILIGDQEETLDTLENQVLNSLHTLATDEVEEDLEEDGDDDDEDDFELQEVPVLKIKILGFIQTAERPTEDGGFNSIGNAGFRRTSNRGWNRRLADLLNGRRGFKFPAFFPRTIDRDYRARNEVRFPSYGEGFTVSKVISPMDEDY